MPVEKDRRTLELRKAVRTPGADMAAASLPTAATPSAAERADFDAREDVQQCLQRVRRGFAAGAAATAAARAARASSGEGVADDCWSCAESDRLIWASSNCCTVSRRANGAAERASEREDDMMPIIETVMVDAAPVVGIIENVVGCLDHEESLTRSIRKLQERFYVALDVLCAAPFGAASDQHHCFLYCLNKSRFEELAQKGYRAMLEAVRAEPEPGTPDARLGHLVGRTPDGEYELFTNPGGEELVGENCGLRTLFTPCCKSRTRHILTKYDRLPKVRPAPRGRG